MTRPLRCPSCGATAEGSDPYGQDGATFTLVQDCVATGDVVVEDDGGLSVPEWDHVLPGRRRSVLRCAPCGYTWPTSRQVALP